MSDYELLFEMAVLPLLLLIVAAIAAYFLRRSVQRFMEINFLTGTTITAAQESRADGKTPEHQRLGLHRLDLASATSFEIPEAAAFARKTHRAVLAAFCAADLAYSALSSTALVLGMRSLHHYPVDVVVALAYLLQWPVLIILLWPMGIPLRTKVSIFGSYVGLGFLLTAFVSSFYRAALLVEASVSFVVLTPLTGVFPLLIRRLRPWLLAMVAVLLFLVVGAIPLQLLKVNTNLPEAQTWSLVLGTSYVVLGIVVAGWMLRRRSWKVPLVVLTALFLLAIFFISQNKMTLGFILIGLPSNVAQVFVVWFIFKALMRFQEREFLPPQVLQSHLCWGVFTLYLLAVVTQSQKLYGRWWWQPWIIVLAYLSYLGILHVSLHKIWKARASAPGRRLLLLRVFGAADKREILLDWLENTWCFVGRIDLIASTDLAVRTLGSRMLESFLLRRTDKQFLHTNVEVDQRLSQLRCEPEGDSRYPINSVYCYANAWSYAVERLAPDADVVLMDLRGFTGRNQGCISELNWIVPHLDLERIVLLTDDLTDYSTLEKVIHRAWEDRLPDSARAEIARPVLTILNVTSRSRSNSHALFLHLLNAAASTSERPRIESPLGRAS